MWAVHFAGFQSTCLYFYDVWWRLNTLLQRLDLHEEQWVVSRFFHVDESMVQCKYYTTKLSWGAEWRIHGRKVAISIPQWRGNGHFSGWGFWSGYPNHQLPLTTRWTGYYSAQNEARASSKNVVKRHS